MTSRPATPETSIYIVGGSVFGLSTALHLSAAGYKDITVFDRAAPLPSPFAASNDLNKIIRAEYGVGHAEDDFYTDLALRAVAAWKAPDDVGGWSSCYNEVGYLRVASSTAKLQAINKDKEYFTSPRTKEAGSLWFPDGSFRAIQGLADIHSAAPQLEKVDFATQWRGYLNMHGGYALASEAIKLAYRRCVHLGVKFVLGEDGHISSLVSAGPMRSITGVQAENGLVHSHPPGKPCLTILCMGAHLPRVLSAAASQVTAKAWSVAHLELTESEAQALAGVPVMNFSELGFWMEPLFVKQGEDGSEVVERVQTPTSSTATKRPRADGKYLLKFACHGGGWTNFQSIQVPGSSSARTVACSVPPTNATSLVPPAVDEAQLRRLVKVSLPASLHERPFVRKSMCWCADTSSSDFVVDFVPGYQDLILAGADSGHMFKFLPTAGEWVRDLVQSGYQKIPRWRWKTAQSAGENGKGTVAWRGGDVRDLTELPGHGKSRSSKL
ncbi:hypothetical protein HRR83_008393 [Exophiala dermatitidis]|uniref:Sarcosine oxidase n=2 Tax=Exophiala dermatitidis TaxID=5970 RepID=H6C5J8_EXODN|nr:sarcosine oxidase [Exophiala dermatitidis NIH/UT8656]KAJ4505399.1 hypothetical protein HRR75_007266 [Exophiala dermatitidis]EHY59856.1 sarcosine oxidase [Exophiala dermatitidis NIH/UT8656]KAJ4506997.1 hypothetical protein HRR73_007816 [Exophiala dermatitidis]KAJ4507593.1 hypothetical protein HRR74_007918 [Exophiala dermatitidis]KAJ4533108.1 hypothetical protein HRR76_008077 [Exophiala dermatitidis]